MSQAALEVEPETEVRGEVSELPPRPASSERLRPREDFDEFDYKPITPLAPVALFLGICALTGFITVIGLSIGLVGAVMGAICLWQIRRAEGELSGRALARIGFGLSVACLVLGSAYHAYAYATEVPEGYERLSFSWLAKQGLVVEEGMQKIAPTAASLEGKQVFLKGYMLTTRQTQGLTDFVLVKDTGECCFGAQPKLTDMIVVHMKDGKTVNHKEQTLVGVAGIFHARPVIQGDQVTAIYSLEGTHFQ